MAKKKSLAAGRRALALFLAVSLILTGASAAPGGPVGQVAASHDGCSQVEEWGWLLSRGLLFDNCDPSDLSDHADDLEELHANATKTDIYNTGQQVGADSEQFLSVLGNYRQDSGTAAMAEAEAAAVEAIDNGKSRSEVEQAAVEAVRDYYTRKQMNLNDQFVVAIETVGTMEATKEAAGLDEGFVNGGTRNDPTQVYYEDHWLGPQNKSKSPVGEVQVTAVNGSTLLSRDLSVTIKANGNYDTGATTLTSIGIAKTPAVNDQITINRVTTGPIDGQPGGEFLNLTDYVDAWNDIESKSTQMESNVEVYAGSLYNQTQNGTANVTDHISCATLSEQYSTDFETTGYYAYLVGFSACQGMAVPQLDNTSLMTIQTVDETYQGLLMSQNPPDGGVWETGVTYNADDIQGLQMVATTDGEVVELEGQFSIQSMEGPDGTEHDTTTVRHINRTVINESADYSDLQAEIRALREEIEDVEPPGGSGGGGDGGLGLDLGLGGTGAIVIAAGAAAFLLLGRN